MMRRREVSGSSTGSIPARASTGSVSARIRPLGSATVSEAMAPVETELAILPERLSAPAAARSLAAARAHPADLRSQRSELAFDALVAAIEMVDAVDCRLALGHEAGDHQPRGRAEVGRHHIGALERMDALDDGRAALDLDVGAEALQLLHVHHAILEDGLGDD